MLTSKQKKVLNACYSKLDYAFSSIHYGCYGKQLFKMIKDEEKGHRKFCPDGIKCGLTISEAVKLFYCQGIIEGITDKLNFTVKDYISIRQSILMCQSLALNYKDEIINALQGVNYSDILSIDYAELMK